MSQRRFHYGWAILVFGWLIYGFGVAPGYYSWGQLLPAAINDLGLDRAQAGLVFGLFTLLYSCSAPLSGMLMNRFGVRALMVSGALVSSLGFFLMSRSQGLLDSLVSYSLLAGLGMGLGVFLPAQTLASNWFLKYRATALAILLTAGGIVGRFVPDFDAAMVDGPGWRQAWVLIAVCSIAVALVALVFVRDTPESVGLFPDGRFRSPGSNGDAPANASPLAAVADDSHAEARATETPTTKATADNVGGNESSGLDPDWDPAAALRTKHFAALTFCAIAFATPWGVAVAHGALHLTDQGFGSDAIKAIMGSMILVSIFGRLSGMVGDWIKPQRALALALALEAIGTIGFLLAPTKPIAMTSAILLGVGFGSAYVCVAATFGAFFGRRAFSVTMGTRMALTGIVNAAMPVIAGQFFDTTGSYVVPFVALATMTATGALIAWVIQAPKPPERSMIAANG